MSHENSPDSKHIENVDKPLFHNTTHRIGSKTAPAETDVNNKINNNDIMFCFVILEF